MSWAYRLAAHERTGCRHRLDSRERALRLQARQRPDHQQSTVLQLGGHLQGPHDHRGGHRPAGASLRDPGVEHPQLPDGAGQEEPHRYLGGMTEKERL